MSTTAAADANDDRGQCLRAGYNRTIRSFPGHKSGSLYRVEPKSTTEPPPAFHRPRPLRGWSYDRTLTAGTLPGEFRERAVGMVFEAEQHSGSQWAAIVGVAEKLGPTAETVRKWVRSRHGTSLNGLIHHSDRGVQYLSIRQTERLELRCRELGRVTRRFLR